MTPPPTDDERRAILAELIRAACELSPSGELERGMIRKITYFLRRRGVPLRFRIDIYNNGVFCPDILFDYDALADLGAIARDSDHPKRKTIRPDEKMDDLLERFASVIAPYRATIADVLEVVAPFDERRMKLMQTIVWSHGIIRLDHGMDRWADGCLRPVPENQVDAATMAGLVVAHVLAEYGKKKTRISREEVETTYWQMDGKRLLEDDDSEE